MCTWHSLIFMSCVTGGYGQAALMFLTNRLDDDAITKAFGVADEAKNVKQSLPD